MQFKLSEILKKVYPPIGLPFVYFGDYGMNPKVKKQDFKIEDIEKNPSIKGEDFKREKDEKFNDFYQQKTQSNKGVPFFSTHKGLRVFMPVFIDNRELPNALISISAQHNIAETPLLAGQGTAKEYLGKKDIQISLVSVLLGESGVYPEQELYKWISLYESGAPIQLSCALTSYFLPSGKNAVFTQLNLPHMQGIMDSQVMEFKLKSDLPLELVLSDN